MRTTGILASILLSSLALPVVADVDRAPFGHGLRPASTAAPTLAGAAGDALPVLAMAPPPAGFSPTRGPTPLTATEEFAITPRDSFRECAACPLMVVVPAGSFLMGSPDDKSGSPKEEGRYDNEGPQQKVTIARPFAVGKFELTFAAWDACVADGGCRGYRPGDAGWGRGKRPVINVSWYDAKAYVEWLSRKTGKGYRLLTEAEGEYVARAETSTPFWWGGTISTEQANYDGSYLYGGNGKSPFRQQTVEVDAFLANPFGLHNVHGNVWEWVEDCYLAGAKHRPTDGQAFAIADCPRRVMRGDSWVSRASHVRSALRGHYTPVVRDRSLGFRVARTLDSGLMAR